MKGDTANSWNLEVRGVKLIPASCCSLLWRGRGSRPTRRSASRPNFVSMRNRPRARASSSKWRPTPGSCTRWIRLGNGARALALWQARCFGGRCHRDSQRLLFCFGRRLAGRPEVLARRPRHSFVRIGRAARETFVTRTGGGRTRFATWRFGSALGAAYLSNVWYPDRLNTFSSGMEQGAATIGLDLLGNVASEFWPDVKHKFSAVADGKGDSNKGARRCGT